MARGQGCRVGSRAGQSPGSAAGSSIGLSKFNTDTQDSPSWINEACRGSDAPRQDALCRCSYLYVQKLRFQMPSS